MDRRTLLKKIAAIPVAAGTTVQSVEPDKPILLVVTLKSSIVTDYEEQEHILEMFVEACKECGIKGSVILVGDDVKVEAFSQDGNVTQTILKEVSYVPETLARNV